jgi:hypothetical protein
MRGAGGGAGLVGARAVNAETRGVGCGTEGVEAIAGAGAVGGCGAGFDGSVTEAAGCT